MFALVAAVVASTALSIKESQKSASFQRKANDVSRKIRERQEQKQRLAAVREAQIARAQNTQMAANAGTVNSSGFSGVQSGITAQTASNIAFANQVGTGQTAIMQYRQAASDSNTKSQNWAAIAQLSMQANNIYEGKG